MSFGRTTTTTPAQRDNYETLADAANSGTLTKAEVKAAVTSGAITASHGSALASNAR